MVSPTSIIFITKNNGIYNDYWNPHNPNEIFWYGQRCGRRDHYVVPGTAVLTRNKNQKQFILIGYVKSKTVEKIENKKATLYKLVISKLVEPEIIKRKEGDILTVNTILRKYGFPLENSITSQGIYKK